MIELNELLYQLNACGDAMAWAVGKNLEQAWQECQRPDWMLWLLGRSTVNRKVIATIAVELAEQCVQNAAKYPDVAKCIEVVKRFLNGQATAKELSAAWSAAWSAAASAAESAEYAARYAARSAAWSAASAAEYAARSAACAACAASAAEYAARSAAWSAAWSAASAAESAARSAAWSAAESASCDIVRKHVPVSVISSLFEVRG